MGVPLYLSALTKWDSGCWLNWDKGWLKWDARCQPVKKCSLPQQQPSEAASKHIESDSHAGAIVITHKSEITKEQNESHCVRHARVPFTSLCVIPKREKTERKRKKPPSYHLTSDEHFDYIQSSKKPKPQI